MDACSSHVEDKNKIIKYNILRFRTLLFCLEPSHWSLEYFMGAKKKNI